jgi:poly(A) polymerase
MTGPTHNSTNHAASREFAVEVVRRLKAAGYIGLWAGGCVRDLLMGREPDDFDVATTATPEQVRDVFGRRRTLTVGESFGVIVVLGPRGAEQVEVATFRTEGPYADGRRPEHVSFSTPEADAQRRDFTINGMFFDPLEEQVLDYVQGEHDLHAGLIRAIGDPHARMTEDKLRMLRAVRFAATLDFELDAATADAVRAMAAEIEVVSWERIAAELQKMLRHRHRRRAVRLMQQVGLLPHVFPELAALAGDDHDAEWNHTLNILDRLQTSRFETAAAVLLRTVPSGFSGQARAASAGTVAAVARRLRLSNEQREEIVWLVEHQHALDGAETFPAARLKRLLAQPLAIELLAIRRAADLAEHRTSASVEFTVGYLQSTSPEEINPPPLITGADILALGQQPGPAFKSWLETIRDAQLNGEVRTREEAIALLERLAQAESSG